jgi:hypothetical protein
MRVSRKLIIALVILAAVFAVLRLTSDTAQQPKPLFPDFRADRAARITIQGRERQTVLEKHEDVWLVTSEDSFPAEAGAAEAILEKIPEFSRKDMISSNPDKQALYQVDSTGTEVSIIDAAGDAVAAFVIGKVGPDYQSTYVRDEESNDVVLTPGYLPPVFERGSRTWQDLTVYSLRPEDIAEIRISRPGETVMLERDQTGQWYVSLPESTACDNGAVSRLVRTLSGLRADYVAGRFPVEGSGVDTPDSSVWFRTASAEEELVFGDRDDKNHTYFSRRGSNLVYLLGSHRVGLLVAGFDDLRLKEPEPEP